MQQVLFRIPFLDLPIYGYGLMMVIGFLAAIQLAAYLGKRCGIHPDVFVNAGLIALITGVLGARLSHVLENFSVYTDPTRSAWANFKDAINIRSGGLTYYGGFLVAFPTLVIYAIRKRVPLRLGMDIVAPTIMIGLGFGRIGCLLNGCCYGATCDVPWAISYPYDSIPYVEQFRDGRLTPDAELVHVTETGRLRLLTPAEVASDPALVAKAAATRSLPTHPAQLYSAFTAFLIAALTLAYFTLPHAPGRVFALMLMAEGVTRFVLELLRVEPPVRHVAGHGLSLSMILGAGLALLGAILWFAFARAGPRTDAPRPGAVQPAT